MWWVIERAGMLLMTTLMGKQLLDSFSDKIKADKVYSTEEVAKILKVEKADVVELILMGRLKAQKVSNTYKILGRNLIETLSESRNKKE
ncbi:MAG: helix-turn-helix domain-containing protein [Nitrospinae bacterium]|nr:helix-turn-helix domain-containing protein [Nitrospinota bacterium]